MKAVLGIDLATRRYQDIGIALLSALDNQVAVRFLRPSDHQLTNPPTVEALADYCCLIAAHHNVQVIAIDGPQAWKSPDNGLIHQRLSEKALNTQAKTGLPGSCKPSTSLRFVHFAIDFFVALEQRGWSRQHSEKVLEKTPFREAGMDQPLFAEYPFPEGGVSHVLVVDATPHQQPETKSAIEVFPTAAWRALGLRPLPAKPASSAKDVQRWLGQLQQQIPSTLESQPNHDELQALMAGLVGLSVLGLEGIGLAGYRSFGQRPVLLDGSWREGFIVNFAEQRNKHGNPRSAG